MTETQDPPVPPSSDPPGGDEAESRDQRFPVQIEDEMKHSFLSYAMSVIVARALPDVRDGLKPVHRRILHAMNELGCQYNKSYKKSARTVGDVIGKYHPHGDAPVYEALVRMAQPFSMRMMLIDGQGNFGSVDGDPPAAMRYTEARLTRLAGELLQDIDKETVDFGPNYDDSTQEPLLLPAAFPNLLVNGSQGIAVGMATSIPPHNLREVIEACVAQIHDPDITLDGLMRIVPGPDFPTGGVIMGRDGIRRAYETGRGGVKVRAVAEVEVRKKDFEQIVVTELPYQVNKAKLIERIAELVGEKKLEGISDVRDESDRDGMRMVIELKRDVSAQVTLNQLWANTALESTFGITMLAIVDGEPKICSLKDVLGAFIEHRREVVTRRTLFELRQAEDKFHIVVGLLAAIDNIDRVIEIIRAANDPPEAKERLMAERFPQLGNLQRLVGAEDAQISGAIDRGFVQLTERQAQAILELRLQRLTGLEREKLLTEAEELRGEMARLRKILSDDDELMRVIVGELERIRDTYADARRTQITGEAGIYTDEDLIAEEEMVVTVSHAGYVKRTPTTEYRAQKRGGKGMAGVTTREEDWVEELFVASTHDYLLVFSSTGRVFWIKVHALPLGARTARGKPLVNLIQIASGEKVSAIVAVRDFEEGRFVITASRRGTVKKTSLVEYSRPRATGIIGAGIDEGDEIIAAAIGSDEHDVLLATRRGMAIRFKASDVRRMGRPSVGVRGIRLDADDELISMTILEPGATILSVTGRGYGKRSRTDDYRVQQRGGRGIILMKLSEKNGEIVATRQVLDQDHIMLITDAGTLIRMRCQDIPILGRNTQGVRLVRVSGEEKVQALANLAEPEDDDRSAAKPLETVAEDADEADADGGDGGEEAPADDES
ncbi:MAG: DNA gyrase subunit A [Deltaproteobacteria bacterium]|nr:DNA gyrase subunit A [Deltaproteobacteria bacterium]